MKLTRDQRCAVQAILIAVGILIALRVFLSIGDIDWWFQGIAFLFLAAGAYSTLRKMAAEDVALKEADRRAAESQKHGQDVKD